MSADWPYKARTAGGNEMKKITQFLTPVSQCSWY